MKKPPRQTRPSARRAAASRRPRAVKGTTPARGHAVHTLPAEDIDALRGEIERTFPAGGPQRWNPDPEDIQRSVAKLVLTLMEFIRKLLERQAIRRMEARTLTPAEVEAVGLALMRLEDTLKTMGERFGLTPEDLNLDLGPLGRLI